MERFFKGGEFAGSILACSALAQQIELAIGTKLGAVCDQTLEAARPAGVS